MKIRKLDQHEIPPMGLMLLADPSQMLVSKYLERGECYVMENNNQIIGVYILVPTSTDKIELANLAVEKALQGNGIGKMLVLNSIERAKMVGYKMMEIGTGNSSIGQLALYQKCGFRITHVDRNFFIRHYDTPIYENGIWCRDMIRLSQEL
ncbi:GNAT family N-acetyltransferase [Oceanobacillus sp. FSL K6-2867]|uniref:GNAT family N-acetyltransferase n=1 Tax=Oceanobacillus sp. FSL K6-2867 TaxID=2954748 RepID=UPI0030DA40C4